MPTDPYLSEIALFSFGFAPRGWAICQGQLLPINQNQALFSLLGTMYGGNGQTTFALPDLRGRVPMGASPSHVQGELAGTETVTLLATQMPVHTHLIDTNALAASARCRNAAANQRTPLLSAPAIEGTGIQPFTDDPLTTGSTTIRAVHITEVRAGIDALRARVGPGVFSWTDSPLTAGGVVIITAQHILELRTALLQAYASGGLTSPAFTDPALGIGTPIKAVHIAEIRTAVLAADTMTYSNAVPDANMNAGAIVMGGAVTAASVGSSQPHSNRMPSLALNYCIALQGIFPSRP